jgi:hypothetical protein
VWQIREPPQKVGFFVEAKPFGLRDVEMDVRGWRIRKYFVAVATFWLAFLETGTSKGVVGSYNEVIVNNEIDALVYALELVGSDWREVRTLTTDGIPNTVNM